MEENRFNSLKTNQSYELQNNDNLIYLKENFENINSFFFYGKNNNVNKDCIHKFIDSNIFNKQKHFKEINSSNNINNEVSLSSNSLKYNIFDKEDDKLSDNSSNNSILKLEKDNNDPIFSNKDKKIIDKISKNIFKIKDYAFLKKKTKNSNNEKIKKINFKEIKNMSNDSNNNDKINNKKIYALDEYKDNFKNLKNLNMKIFQTNKYCKEDSTNNFTLISNENKNNCSKINNLNNIKLVKVTKNDVIDEKKLNLTRKKFVLDQVKDLNISSNKKNVNLKWTIDEDKKLIKIKEDFPYLTWQQISQFFENRSKKDCMNRYTKVIDPNLKKGKWTEEEDKILADWVSHYGDKNWADLIKSNVLKGRNCKQVRERWLNNLCPNIKKLVWNEKNERILLEKFLIYGTSWTKISAFIPNSSENILKNKFYSLLRKTVNQYLNLNKNHKNQMDLTIFDTKIYTKKEDKVSINDSNTDFVEKIKNMNKRNNNILKKDITDVYLKNDEMDNSNTKANSIYQNSLFFDNSNYNSFIENENSKLITKKNKRIKNNFSLEILLNYLPILLKERKIDYEKIISQKEKLINEDEEKNIKKSKKNQKLLKILNNKLDYSNEKVRMKLKVDFINAIRKPFEKKKKS